MVMMGGWQVLLDVPCSGLGVLAKRADLRWRREEAGLAQQTQLQVLRRESSSQAVTANLPPSLG